MRPEHPASASRGHASEAEKATRERKQARDFTPPVYALSALKAIARWRAHPFEALRFPILFGGPATAFLSLAAVMDHGEETLRRRNGMPALTGTVAFTVRMDPVSDTICCAIPALLQVPAARDGVPSTVKVRSGASDRLV